MNMFNLLSKFQRLRDKSKGRIRQLFRATDFESLMYPCFTFCRILGIFPYKINASTIKIYKSSNILSIVIICVFCVCQLMVFYDINIRKNYIFKGTPKALERNCFFILGGFITVFAFSLNGPRMRLLQSILEVSLRLSQESYQNLSRLIHAKDIFLFLLMTVTGLIYCCLLEYSALRNIFALYIFLLILQMDMLYMNCVCILKACFKQINDRLANLRSPVNDEPHFLRGTYNKQRNQFLLMEFEAIKKQHAAISNTVQMLNIIFTLHLLSMIIMTFTEITFNLYFYLVQLKESVSVSSLEREIHYGGFVTIVTYYVINIVLIVWACETNKNQAMEINTTVQDMSNSTDDREMKYELQLFSLQLIHRETVFSAKGLTVDATLLRSMAGGITTHILILIQFLFMSNCYDRKAL